MVVAGGPLQLELELADERLVVEQPGELVVPRLVRELGSGAVEVGDDALGDQPVDRVVQAALHEQDVLRAERAGALRDEAPEHTAQEQELDHDLARREPQRLAAARVLAGLDGERAAGPEPLRPGLDDLPAELGDERRDVAELPETAEPLQRGHLVVAQPLVHGGDGKLPGAGLDRRSQLLQGGCGLARRHCRVIPSGRER